MSKYWKCPRENCDFSFTAVTEIGVRALSERHLKSHGPEPPPKPKTPEEYEILKINRVDIGFLKTRGIKLDDKIVLDPNQKYNPYLRG